MTPLRLFRLNADLEMEEVFFHGYAIFFRFLAINVRAFCHWMLTREMLSDDYLRYGREKPSDLHRRLTVRWGIKEHLKTKLK